MGTGVRGANKCQVLTIITLALFMGACMPRGMAPGGAFPRVATLESPVSSLREPLGPSVDPWEDTEVQPSGTNDTEAVSSIDSISIEGNVIHIFDGGTIDVEGVLIRLKGVTAPELDEPGGIEALSVMHQITNETGRHLSCELNWDTNFGRYLGICYTETGIDVAAVMVARGVARDCPRYSGGRYGQFETDDSRQLPLPDYCLSLI